MMFGTGMGLGLIFMLALWGGLIALTVWLVYTLFPKANQSRPAMGHEPSSLEILNRRYARGEISREQYDLMRDTLMGGLE